MIRVCLVRGYRLNVENMIDLVCFVRGMNFLKHHNTSTLPNLQEYLGYFIGIEGDIVLKKDYHDNPTYADRLRYMAFYINNSFNIAKIDLEIFYRVCCSTYPNFIVGQKIKDIDVPNNKDSKDIIGYDVKDVFEKYPVVNDIFICEGCHTIHTKRFIRCKECKTLKKIRMFDVFINPINYFKFERDATYHLVPFDCVRCA